MRFSNRSLGVIGMLPPALPNFFSSDCCTLSAQTPDTRPLVTVHDHILTHYQSMFIHQYSFIHIITIRYDTIEEFNVDSKAECDQVNLAHAMRKNIKKKKLFKQIPVPTSNITI